ncbi:MAG: EAL domain-containing protein [Clostridia bacterium]|nr:EAL domain-containing protein [Clostridia bacterium]
MGISLEAVSLLITLVLAMFHGDRQQRSSRRYRLFNDCLGLSALAIALNIVSSLTINYAAQVPLLLNEAINTCYFLAQHANLTALVGYGLYLINEHVPNRHCFRKSGGIVLGLGVVLEILVLFNPWTKWFFYFENGVYMRGPVNKLAFAIVGAELCMAVCCYVRNRHYISRAIHRLMASLPVIITMFLLVQLMLPDVMMVGMVSAIVNLIFYISFQSNRIGQDALTELPNRHTLFQSLSNRMRKGKRLHLIMVNLDHFESVNRKFGTRQGDALLYAVARYLESFAPRYQVYRSSSTRFTLVGEYVSFKTAQACAYSIQARFVDPWETKGIEHVLEASLAHIVTNTSDRDESRVAEQLSYTISYAQERGGSVVFFDERLRGMYERRLYVLEQIRRALEEESFEVYFQPVFSCREGRFTTAESLLRLFDKNGVLIPPGEFIPLAEKNGLIDEISWLVLKKVCQFIGAHPELPLDSISINMSIQQLSDRSFMRRVHSCQAQYGVPAGKLRIEITERTVTENPSMVRAVMNQMTGEGIRFYLDDFGVGYSNLASMISLPFETVKLDSSLLSDIENNEKLAGTVALLVKMLHNAGFVVVAEGIERLAQLECVKTLDVDRIQGYYYARPMPPKELETFLTYRKLVLMKSADVV